MRLLDSYIALLFEDFLNFQHIEIENVIGNGLFLPQSISHFQYLAGWRVYKNYESLVINGANK